MNFGQIKDLAVETFSEWNEDKAPRLAAALSYYTVFSLAPLLVIVIAIAGIFLGQSDDQAQSQVIGQIATVVGQDAADAIGDLLQSANRPQLGSLAGILGLAALLFGAAGLFGQLQDALNTIWEVAPKPDRGIWGIIRDRFFSFTMVLGTGFLLLVSLIITTALSATLSFVAGDSFEQTVLGWIVNFVISALVTWLLFALIFKIIPDVEIAWRDVALGAGITTILFVIGRILLSLYLANSATTSAYGAAGSLVLLLIWVYYSAQILFMGAEFTQVYARRYGSRIRPSQNAVPLSEEARATQGMPRKENLQAAAAGRSEHAGAAPKSRTTPRPALGRPQSLGAAAGGTSRAGLAGLALLTGLFGIFASRRRRR